MVDALDSKSSSFGSVGSIPTQGTDKAQKGANSSKLKKRACFFFGVKRSVCFCAFQNERSGNFGAAKESHREF